MVSVLLCDLCILFYIVYEINGIMHTDANGNVRVIAARKDDPPPCSTQPGITYCENVRDYPYDTILNAIKNSPFDIAKLLVDETRDEGPSFGPSVKFPYTAPDDYFKSSGNRIFLSTGKGGSFEAAQPPDKFPSGHSGDVLVAYLLQMYYLQTQATVISC